MRILLIAIAIAILFTLFFLPFIIRAYARARAGNILYGQQPITEKRINRYIAILTWSNKWITNHTELDDRRIFRLRHILDEMQKPHG